MIITDNLKMSTNQECNGSIELLFEMCKKEILASKEGLAATLHAHQAAVNATKSPQRDAAEEYYQN